MQFDKIRMMISVAAVQPSVRNSQWFSQCFGVYVVFVWVKLLSKMTHFSWCTPHITQRRTQGLDRLFIHCCVGSPSARGERTTFLLTSIPFLEDSAVTNMSKQQLHAESYFFIHKIMLLNGAVLFLKWQMHFIGVKGCWTGWVHDQDITAGKRSKSFYRHYYCQQGERTKSHSSCFSSFFPWLYFLTMVQRPKNISFLNNVFIGSVSNPSGILCGVSVHSGQHSDR